MQLTDAPHKIVEAFATNGAKNTIPVTVQPAPGAATYDQGFPPETMQKVNVGGVPPAGMDFNGVLFDISAITRWFNSGAGFPFDVVFATTVGGYPKGARVLKADSSGYWLCTVDNNLSNPNTGGSGWVSDGAKAVSSVFVGGLVTLVSGDTKVPFNTVEFDSGLWDSTNNRFLAPYTGKFRFTGAVFAPGAPAQNYALTLRKNNIGVRLCSNMAQVSNENITFPFDAIIALAAGDFVEVFLNSDQTGKTVGSSGNPSAFAFAQCEFLG